MLLNLYFKATCSIRPHVYGLMGGLKIDGTAVHVVPCHSVGFMHLGVFMDKNLSQYIHTIYSYALVALLKDTV